MIYTIKVKPTIIKSVKELILYSIVYSIKHKISDPKSMQFDIEEKVFVSFKLT